MSYRIPIGPFHPALEEPYKLDLICDGETVREAELHVGFNFRDIEYLAERRNYQQTISLVERVCGICSNVHSLTFCLAVERLLNLQVPERAQYIRVAMAELERLHSHILWAGIAAKLIGFKTMFMSCFAMREKVMDTLEMISGNRVNYGMNCFGGVVRDMSDSDAVLRVVDAIEKELVSSIIPVFTTNSTVRDRCAGIGVLTTEHAMSMGIVGPLARASGVEQDLRRDAPYLVYDRLEFDVPVQTDGDVRARLVVRALELIESCRILRQVMRDMPDGPIAASSGSPRLKVPAGTALARIEAPRGEVFYSVTSNGSDVPQRVKVRTPTFANMPSMQWAVIGAQLADAPLIQASIDPCYSCTDR
jgi:Ni,Fe-hydrogenase III large subunit